MYIKFVYKQKQFKNYLVYLINKPLFQKIKHESFLYFV